MSKKTNNQRHEAMQIPYGMVSVSENDEGETVYKLTGVYYSTKFIREEWRTVYEFLDLGTHETRDLAFAEEKLYRADPESYYDEHQRKQDTAGDNDEQAHEHEHVHRHGTDQEEVAHVH